MSLVLPEYSKIQLSNLLEMYIESESVFGALRYIPLYRCFIKGVSINSYIRRIKTGKLNNTPINVLSSSEVYSELRKNSKKCISDPLTHVCCYRLARFRNLMFKTKIEDVPLYINTSELSVLARWRLHCLL